MRRCSWPRIVAAVLAAIFALPSCVTAMLWRQQQVCETETVACAAAVACPIDADGVQIALRLSAGAAAALGVEAGADDVWIVLQPEHPAEVAEFLREARAHHVGSVTFSIRFEAVTAAEPRMAKLNLGAALAAAPGAGNIEDARPSRRDGQWRELHGHCRWQPAATAPTGDPLLPPELSVETLHQAGTPLPFKVLLTPATVVIDAALLPFELIALGIYALSI